MDFKLAICSVPYVLDDQQVVFLNWVWSIKIRYNSLAFISWVNFWKKVSDPVDFPYRYWSINTFSNVGCGLLSLLADICLSSVESSWYQPLSPSLRRPLMLALSSSGNIAILAVLSRLEAKPGCDEATRSQCQQGEEREEAILEEEKGEGYVGIRITPPGEAAEEQNMCRKTINTIKTIKSMTFKGC
ncbi:hypothetical protein F511_42351 [Dorcoceras hygrometricum]|uniref:Uncharacterized protein n=1 Tax=Dorcoceras hygrometricum TaxID=472368 RepID=A0A2Z7ARH5_9LAMI|nr:hypothetical protein F511_42351 [Dorcoceras hygrometricum]